MKYIVSPIYKSAKFPYNMALKLDPDPLVKLEGIALLTSNLLEAICCLPSSNPYGLNKYCELPKFPFGIFVQQLPFSKKVRFYERQMKLIFDKWNLEKIKKIIN